MIQQAIRNLVEGRSLDSRDAESCVGEIVEGGASQAQMGAFLVALRAKGESPDEIAAFASALRGYSVRIHPAVGGRLVDTCGTGGDTSKTFNVSTISAVVAAGAGASVAKHGNRSVTGRCGSADLMESLGFNLAVEPPRVEESIERNGIGFMFAPTFHPAMKKVAPVRKEVGVRTIFNLMGPLLNPAGANSQLVGVYAPTLVPVMAEVLGKLGTERAMVVHGLEGMDEISVSEKTLISTLNEDSISTREYSPSDFGLQDGRASVSEPSGPDEAAALAVGLLSGRGTETASMRMVLANASASLVVAGLADSLPHGVELARRSIASGAAMKKLTELVRSSGGEASRIEALAAEA
ncbi:MAG: anthranilate phosphoribosyltransferase [Nitrososphaerota archaeon]|nr:anthranilate phosphoribosyltransferase [Nitrososphaerota archaeon]